MERKFSKAKANAGHVVWSSREVIPLTFQLNGIPIDGSEFAVFRVPASPMYCSGFRVAFQVPSSDRKLRCSVSLYTGGNILVPDTTLALNGITYGGDKTLRPNLAMPPSSVWKAKMAVVAPDGSEDYYPQTATLTYLLRYATGPVSSALFSTSEVQSGIGFDKLGQLLVI